MEDVTITRMGAIDVIVTQDSVVIYVTYIMVRIAFLGVQVFLTAMTFDDS